MAHTFEELKKKKVVELREIAKGIEHEAVKGYTQMNKEHLLEAICKALDIDMHKHHEVVGLDKTTIKAKIKAIKKKRDEALAARSRAEHKYILRMIHALKRKIHKATV
jgi:DNA-binding IclR family transcriptional regulator